MNKNPHFFCVGLGPRLIMCIFFKTFVQGGKDSGVETRTRGETRDMSPLGDSGGGGARARLPWLLIPFDFGVECYDF